MATSKQDPLEQAAWKALLQDVAIVQLLLVLF